MLCFNDLKNEIDCIRDAAIDIRNELNIIEEKVIIKNKDRKNSNMYKPIKMNYKQI